MDDVGHRPRFEVLPVGRAEEEAMQVPDALRLTVTSSPKLGPDRSLAVAARLRALGHSVTVHVAARMVRDNDHLESLLAEMAKSGVDDMFVIAGDLDHPQGSYESAGELLHAVAASRRRPRLLGIAGYPEGHPFISDRELMDALKEKSRLADYVTTQLCFDPEALRRWIERRREDGLTLPVFIGMPGKVARRRLMRMSTQIGVGQSLRFLRKQRGVRSLFGPSLPDRLHDALESVRDDPALNVAGFHYFTFNQLIDTWRWQQAKDNAAGVRDRRRNATPARPRVHPEESMT